MSQPVEHCYVNLSWFKMEMDAPTLPRIKRVNTLVGYLISWLAASLVSWLAASLVS